MLNDAGRVRLEVVSVPPERVAHYSVGERIEWRLECRALGRPPYPIRRGATIIDAPADVHDPSASSRRRVVEVEPRRPRGRP